MQKIEHIGIAVEKLEESSTLFEALLGKAAYKEEFVAGEMVNTLFFDGGNTKIELLESRAEGSAIDKFIKKKGEGIHHIAFAVEDIEKSMKELSEKGFKLLNEKPKKGADNKLVAFFHPKTTNGVLIEICQEIENQK